ncbi:MAG: 5-carboxymethyl-2-hydroxymuconate isomerase [Actinomycetota bacterium]
MPHIVIEHSANLEAHADVDDLVAVVHAAAIADGLPPADGLRTRAVSREHYRIADGDPAWGFVAITARIGAGRADGDKRRFLDALTETADAWAREIAPLDIAVSVELQEIDPAWRANRNHVRAAMERRRTAS